MTTYQSNLIQELGKLAFALTGDIDQNAARNAIARAIAAVQDMREAGKMPQLSYQTSAAIIRNPVHAVILAADAFRQDDPEWTEHVFRYLLSAADAIGWDRFSVESRVRQ